MTLSTSTLDELTLSVSHEVQINARIEVAFDALLEEMGPQNEAPDGTPLPMKIEPRPGGRWYRDLGDDNGHLWGHVQSIKRPALLEITGPLFLSYAVVSNLLYRLTEVDGGTQLVFKQRLLGLIPEENRAGLSTGWVPLLDRVRRRAEHGKRD